MSTAPRSTRDDAAARALAQDEFRVPLVIEAGAGTGKTALLVARVAAWCVGAGWRRHTRKEDPAAEVARRIIEGVVAITFTEPAAAEMATRIGEALGGLAGGVAPVGWEPGDVVEETGRVEVAARAAALCGEVHRIKVTTIHSFCQRVLAAHPFEVGLHPRFEIDADGTALESLADEVVLEALRELDRGPRRDDWERLAVRGEGPTRVAEALRALIESGAGPDDLARDPFSDDEARSVIADVVGVLRDFLDAEAGRLAGLKGVAVAVQTVDALNAMARQLDAAGSRPGFIDLAASLGHISSKVRDRLRDWSKAKLGVKEGQALAGGADRVAELAGRLVNLIEQFKGLDPEAFGAARRVLLELLGEVETRRAERGIATFQDLLEKTARLFEEHDGICGAERRGMDQLLVDEFQDTDDVQCRIVRRLALEGPEDERPGLFVVGDPKQSIYAWRSADLVAYDGFVDDVRSQGGLKRSLTRNFRSVRPILDEVERVVEPVMVREHGFQPAFEALEATGERALSAGFDHLPWSAVEHWICWCADNDGKVTAEKQTKPKMTSLEAAAIGTDIRRLHDEAGVKFGDVAVLLRTRTAQGDLLEAFRELDVPFEVSREREYFKQREIIEAAALVRAILEPADSLALLTVIRSDVVGVPDAVLAPLWDAGLPAIVAGIDGPDDGALDRARLIVDTAVVPKGMPGLEHLPRWHDALVGALESLAELRRSMRSDPPDTFVERLRTLWLAEVSGGARHLGRFRQIRLDGFFADLEQTLVRGSGSGADIARFLRRAVEEGGEAPTVSEPDRDADAVHVMTIYGAKGLDFEHVYLAQIHKGTGSFGAPAAVVRRTEGAAELLLFGWPSPGFGAAEHRRELQARAECVRLLYVAMTRAKQRLVVSGGWSAPGADVDPLDASTLADLIAHRGDPRLIGGLLDRRLDREAGHEPGVSWVIPALADGGVARPGGAGKRGPKAVGRELAVADAAAIAEARRTASKRMAARWTTAASDAAHRSIARMETEIGEEAARVQSPSGRSAAAVVGTAVHGLLENLDLGGDLAAQVIERRLAVIACAVTGLDRDGVCAATERLEELLESLAGSECLRRLNELAPRIIARELPVFLRPNGDSGTSVISGAIDLVYRDPEDGRLVVADYKTDAVERDAEIEGRLETYKPQLEIYADALRKALDLDHRPHTELWFLHPDRIVRL